MTGQEVRCRNVATTFVSAGSSRGPNVTDSCLCLYWWGGLFLMRRHYDRRGNSFAPFSCLSDLTNRFFNLARIQNKATWHDIGEIPYVFGFRKWGMLFGHSCACLTLSPYCCCLATEQSRLVPCAVTVRHCKLGCCETVSARLRMLEVSMGSTVTPYVESTAVRLSVPPWRWERLNRLSHHAIRYRSSVPKVV